MSASTLKPSTTIWRAPKKTKACGGCKRSRLTIHFHKSSSNPDGLQSQCIDCIKTAARMRRRLICNPVSVLTKRCCGCDRVKKAWQFRIRTHAKDGLTSRCKSCLSAKTNKEGT